MNSIKLTEISDYEAQVMVGITGIENMNCDYDDRSNNITLINHLKKK